MIKLINIEAPTTINVLKMQDGQLGVIKEWSGWSDNYVGLLVYRHGDDLIQVGGTRGQLWERLFRDIKPNTFERCYVRVLNPGEKVIVEIL